MADSAGLATARQETVSFTDEPLILVDSDDREVGFLDKAACHLGSGTLHRAFSLFVFNDDGELLLQQRSPNKPLWPMFWSNSCCSHPRRGETQDEAVHRRLVEELGMTADLEFVYKFEYQAQFNDSAAERELCWVWIGRATSELAVNREEIHACRWLSAAALDAELTATPDRFTPWFKLEWEALRTHHAARLPA